MKRAGFSQHRMQRYLKLVTPAAALAGGYFAGYATAPKVQEATGAPPFLLLPQDLGYLFA